jgi:amidohydrolase
MHDIGHKVNETYHILHAIPEVGFCEYNTAAFLASELEKGGYAVRTGIGGTGVIGELAGTLPGPVVGLRADMDALIHTVDGVEKCIHSCGHDAHSAMVLTAAQVLSTARLARGKVKIIFQPAEEKMVGALAMIETGLLNDLSCLIGIHLRPILEAKTGQAIPALYSSATFIVEAIVNGVTAHGARPHLGINVIDAAAAIVHAVNGINLDPAESWSIKTTKLQAGGSTLNSIPDVASMAFDLRARKNAVMDEILSKLSKVVEFSAAAFGAKAAVTIKGGVPAAEYDSDMVEIAREAITSVVGSTGLLDASTTLGGEDFHYFSKRIPKIRPVYIGLGCNLTPGLHHADMTFDLSALPLGVSILVETVKGAICKF